MDGAPPPCHRCQLFGHSSHNYHRPMRCRPCGSQLRDTAGGETYLRQLHWPPHDERQEMPGFSPGGTRERTESPSPAPLGEIPEAPRGYKGTQRSTTTTPETHHGGKTQTLTPYHKL
ncbi:hypothetical protein EVAR_77933_1 [Eumeta japonica]|uniref:Uncharacterized protein n=1 Tax=Eumeta variegata TaxID=151549 RepID=A0A4C1XQV5_EUMVA|nr:hypothetical protein EVAR_77933_1 [Eumeta japonica]